MNLFLLGAVTMGFLVGGLFFLRFWKATRDRLFLAFAVSFFLEVVNRAALALSDKPNEGEPLYYLVRLTAYLLILLAIADKNFPHSTAGGRASRPRKPSTAANGKAAQS